MIRAVAERPVWTPGRKVMGNLLPALVAVPFAATGIWLALKEGILYAPALISFGVAFIAALGVLNWYGLYDNESMRQTLDDRLHPASGSQFVGVARPDWRDWLDPHEDLGFLVVEPEQLTVLGEKRNYVIERKDVLEIGFRGNPHAWIGLGGFIVVRSEDQTLLIEPRSKRSLLANKQTRKELKRQLEAWAGRKKGPATLRRGP